MPLSHSFTSHAALGQIDDGTEEQKIEDRSNEGRSNRDVRKREKEEEQPVPASRRWPANRGHDSSCQRTDEKRQDAEIQKCAYRGAHFARSEFEARTQRVCCSRVARAQEERRELSSIASEVDYCPSEEHEDD